MVGSIIACKGLRVGDFHGRSLSTSFSSSLEENPDLPEARALRAWYDAEGSTAHIATMSGASSGGGAGGGGAAASLATRTTMSQIKDLGLANDNTVYTVKGTITFLRAEMERPPWYPACPTEKCGKKLVLDMSGSWRCEKCAKNFAQPEYRYILPVSAVDHSGSEQFTMFNETAAMLLGQSAGDMCKIKEDGESGQVMWDSVLQRARNRTFMFRVRVKMESIREEQRLKASVIGMRPVEYGKECRLLLDAIKMYETKA